MNPRETKQVIARDEGWVPAAERVKINPTNAFTISADVPEILMQQFWYTIEKIEDSKSYEFLLANKRCMVDAEVFKKILDISPKRQGEKFIQVQNDEDTLTFLIDLGYTESYKMFILYSTGEIPPKKSRWKGSQGKKTADTTEETVDVSEESDPEPLVRKKTSSRRVKKKATISAADNIVPDPNIALELGKSISLTKAEEEAAARQKRTYDSSKKLKGAQTLTPAEQKADDTIKSLKESKKTSRRQAGTRVSSEETGSYEESEHSDRNVEAEDKDDETESDSEEIYKYKIKVYNDADEEMTDDETVERKIKEKGGID
nr:hypothetical protein [Tanacetum cinerariifolium]